jgi:hypothetical protein
MPTTVTAADGDSLCKFAVDAGFLNCEPLRALAENKFFLDRPLKAGDIVTIPDIVAQTLDKASDATHEFVKLGGPPAQIRFVHGSPTIPYKDDVTLDHLEVSAFITDKGGSPDGSADLPDENFCEFNQVGHDDDDTFKVEVFDPANTGKEIDVVIEALRPVLNPDGTVKEHTFFDGSVDDAASERGKRSLKVKAKKVGKSTNTMRFRSPYLRLVVDEADKSGTVDPLPAGTFPEKTKNKPRPKQTILVTDMVDAGDDTVEILDQLVEARFEFKNCPQTGDKKCAARVRLPLGDDRQKVKVAVHILRRQIGSNPVVTPANARRRILKWIRRVMAQASIGPDLLSVREVDPFENFLSVSNPAQNAPAGAGGRLAAGDGRLGFTISATGQPTQVVGPITPPAGQSALDTATALAALVTAPFSATAFPVPVRSNDTRAAADILVRGPAGVNVVLSAIKSDDSAQTLEVIRLNPFPAVIFETDAFNTFMGTVHQRAICRNYDTGDDRVDLFVIDKMDQDSRGEAMIRGHKLSKPANQGVSGVFLSVFMARRCMDGTDNDPIVLPHELGHTVAEVFHANPTHQMMHAEVTGNVAVGASKRIRDANIGYGGTTDKINLHLRYRAEGAVVMRPW